MTWVEQEIERLINAVHHSGNTAAGEDIAPGHNSNFFMCGACERLRKRLVAAIAEPEISDAEKEAILRRAHTFLRATGHET